jgi:hypothetical protein
MIIALAVIVVFAAAKYSQAQAGAQGGSGKVRVAPRSGKPPDVDQRGSTLFEDFPDVMR